MTQRDRAAIDVDLSAVELQIANEFFRDHGKGLVDFKQVDVIQVKSGFGQDLLRCRHRRIQHQCRAIAKVGGGNDTRARLQAVLVGVSLRGQQQRARAIHHARRVTGVVNEIDLTKLAVLLPNQTAIGIAGSIDH